MKHYEKPTLTVEAFENTDVITTSLLAQENNNDKPYTTMLWTDLFKTRPLQQ